MKKNEIIELNGKEYTLELNRESFLQVDKLCNIDKTFELVNRDLYEYIDNVELSDDFNPTQMLDIDDDKILIEVEAKEKALHRLIERALFLWLYPNHKLPISEVKELIKPYLENEEKAEWIGKKVAEYLNECKEIRIAYLDEQKNLKALANKKN